MENKQLREGNQNANTRNSSSVPIKTCFGFILLFPVKFTPVTPKTTRRRCAHLLIILGLIASTCLLFDAGSALNSMNQFGVQLHKRSFTPTSRAVSCPCFRAGVVHVNSKWKNVTVCMFCLSLPEKNQRVSTVNIASIIWTLFWPIFFFFFFFFFQNNSVCECGSSEFLWEIKRKITSMKTSLKIGECFQKMKNTTLRWRFGSCHGNRGRNRFFFSSRAMLRNCLGQKSCIGNADVQR